MSHCQVCNKRLGNGKRGNALYCSAKCRQAAYRKRSNAMRVMQASQLDLFQQQDLATIKTVSVMAADFVVRVGAIVGKELAEQALDAMWDLALHCGCDLSARVVSK